MSNLASKNYITTTCFYPTELLLKLLLTAEAYNYTTNAILRGVVNCVIMILLPDVSVFYHESDIDHLSVFHTATLI